jgi:hypothetical protein
MQYKKITVEVIVAADESDAVVAQLNAALDHIDETHTLFGGDVEAVAFEHSGKRRRSALGHTLAAGGTAVDALKIARNGMKTALRAVI